jgi:hypothetical protein
MKKYVVVDIGCIECGESTEILGIYNTRKDAKKDHKVRTYFSGGQHVVEIIEGEEVIKGEK